MNVEERLRIRIMREVSDQFLARGEVHVTGARLEDLGEEEGASHHETEHVVRALVEEGCLRRGTGSSSAQVSRPPSNMSWNMTGGGIGKPTSSVAGSSSLGSRVIAARMRTGRC